MKFALAFDIDGTCCLKNSGWVPGLLQACRDLHKNSGQLIFVTGRTTAWSLQFLKALEVPFKLGALNGAEISDFPSGKLIASSHIAPSCIDALLQKTQAPAIIYTGTKILHRPGLANTSFQSHLATRKAAQNESWHEYEVGKLSSVLAVRIFMFKEEAFDFACAGSDEGVTISLMRDSFNSDVWIAQITGSHTDKGFAASQLAGDLPFIAFGDDHNDVPLFRKARRAYAIQGAPEELTALAERTISSEEIPKIVESIIEQYRK